MRRSAQWMQPHSQMGDVSRMTINRVALESFLKKADGSPAEQREQVIATLLCAFVDKRIVIHAPTVW
jgi:hypothetical protein